MRTYLLLMTLHGSVCTSVFQARGAVDYLEISKHFHTVILRNIPRMTLKQKSEAKRFIVMVDTFYDNKV